MHFIMFSSDFATLINHLSITFLLEIRVFTKDIHLAYSNSKILYAYEQIQTVDV